MTDRRRKGVWKVHEGPWAEHHRSVLTCSQGMPFKWYHGKTGLVWNVSKRAIGVEINKQASSSQGGLGDQAPAELRHAGFSRPCLIAHAHMHVGEEGSPKGKAGWPCALVAGSHSQAESNYRARALTLMCKAFPCKPALPPS